RAMQSGNAWVSPAHGVRTRPGKRAGLAGPGPSLCTPGTLEPPNPGHGPLAPAAPTPARAAAVGYARRMNRLPPLILALAGLAVALSPAPVRAQAYADMILADGKVWTGNPAQPEAEAIAILDGRVAAVGSDAEIRRWTGPDTQVFELRGRRVVPGFNDAHVHFFDGGQGLASVQLRDAPSPEVFRDRIGAYAASLDKGRWVLNGNWDHERWTPAELPTRQLIDA